MREIYPGSYPYSDNKLVRERQRSDDIDMRELGIMVYKVLQWTDNYELDSFDDHVTTVSGLHADCLMFEGYAKTLKGHGRLDDCDFNHPEYIREKYNQVRIEVAKLQRGGPREEPPSIVSLPRAPRAVRRKIPVHLIGQRKITDMFKQ
jgi:hypothetical protein